jgi:hypothetical protein
MSLFGSNRRDTREVFFQTWKKLNNGEPLDGIEAVVGRIVQAHPEYHSLLSRPEVMEDADYLPEQGQTNPFLHMGMHVAIEEQLSIDQPRGIREQFKKLLLRNPDPHESQHVIMECLGEMLWQSQRQQLPPDEKTYLQCLERFTEK